MRLLALSGLALLIGQSDASPRLVVPDLPDVMIRTRRTIDGQPTSATTQVLYLKGARQRREVSVDPPVQARTGIGADRRSAWWVNISQCDQRRLLVLNQDARTYLSHPIDDPATDVARPRAGASPLQGPAGPDVPAVTVTIDAVDTGERRRFGHYVARHVITTTTVEPVPGAGMEPGTDRQDGWYIDVPDAGCVEWDGARTALASGPNAAFVHPVVIKLRGTARRGYPIQETRRSGGQRYTTVTRVDLLELSEAPLDAALFAVPADYRPALPLPYGGYDLTKPDTVLNRVISYREVVVSWADYLLHHGLLGILPGTRPPRRY